MMLTQIIAIGLYASFAEAQGSFEDWHPAGAGDLRGPCPMLNTLANHAFLPHDGKNIMQENVRHALGTALNISQELSDFLFGQAITTNPTLNATEFSLANLGRHGILEHDASLSRADYYWGNDSISFNQTVFDQTRFYWTSDIVDLKMAANARLARLITSVATNPEYSLSHLAFDFDTGETAAYILILGDSKSGTVQRELLEYFFQNERLPVELGWKSPSASVGTDELGNMMARVLAATDASEFLPGRQKVLLARGGLHAPSKIGHYERI